MQSAYVSWRMRLVTLLGLLVASVLGCSGGGRYVWVNELPPDATTDGYVIGAGDLLSVRVYNQENLSTHARVRSDGKIAMPLVGEVDVRGKAPALLSKELETKLKEFMVSPTVTITVEETPPTSVTVIGQVVHPGIYTVDSTSGVLQALAVAGGFNDYASRGSIYVMRRSSAQRVRFTFADLTRLEGQASMFRIRSGDVVVVE
jgi:polysaccharide biosynthesis/export protein